MFSFVIFFLLGDLYLQIFSQLPPIFILTILFLLSICLWLLFQKRYGRYAHFSFSFILGFTWATWYANSLLAWSLPKEAEGHDISLTGHIASLPFTDQWGTKFIFSVEQYQFKGRVKKGRALLRLTWR